MKVIPIVQQLNSSCCASHYAKQNQFKQRVWVQGARPEEEEIFQFTMVQVPVCFSFPYGYLSYMAILIYCFVFVFVESRRLMGWLLAN
jgi:hypothetical protein